jgi:hypothetical protein
MKRGIALLLALFASLFFSCKKESSAEEEEVKKVIEQSLYTGKDFDRATDEGETIPHLFNPVGLLTNETIPWVRFRRKIDSLERSIRVRIPAYPGYPETTALATVTSRLSGRFFVNNRRDSPVIYIRPILDSGYSQIYLTRGNRGWRIRKITPKILTTISSPSLLSIVKIRAEASPSGKVFEITNPDTFLSKNELPTFSPNDTVRVEVTVHSDTDSGWVFLHRGPRGIRVREPFYKRSTYIFERTWIIGSEPAQTPVVRHAAIDFILWPTLFGDSTASYNAKAWALPYIIKKEEENYPEED